MEAMMRNPAIEEYISRLYYDPRQILSVVPDGTTSTKRDTSRSAGPNGVIVCTAVDHDARKNLDEVAILNPSSGIIFPGALIRADRALMEGKPTPIALARRPARLTINLPGLARPSGEVVPTFADVQKFMNDKLEEWNATAAREGYVNQAASIFTMTKAYSKEQVALDLGVKAEWASGKASAQLDVASSAERSVMVGYYKQVFYSVIMDTPPSPGSVFDYQVGPQQARDVFNDEHPPAYVNRVDYGRIFLIRMETSGSETTANLRAAFAQATGQDSVAVDLKAKASSIISNSSFSVLAVGGGPDFPVQSFQGARSGKVEGLDQYFAAVRYSRGNPGWPIAYTVAFLKDNTLATMGATAKYVETNCVSYPNGFVKVWHDGGYVAKFRVSWQEPSGVGDKMVNKTFESGEQTAGYTKSVAIPGDAKSVKIYAEAATGLVWSPWGEIMNVERNGPDNKTYRAYGTTLDRKWEAN